MEGVPSLGWLLRQHRAWGSRRPTHRPPWTGCQACRLSLVVVVVLAAWPLSCLVCAKSPACVHLNQTPWEACPTQTVGWGVLELCWGHLNSGGVPPHTPCQEGPGLWNPGWLLGVGKD